ERDAERVRADAEERGLPERDVAGVAGEEVPGGGERRVHQRQYADVDDPGRREDVRERDAGAREREPACEARCAGARHSTRSRVPKIPCGRTSRTAIRTTKNEN